MGMGQAELLMRTGAQMNDDRDFLRMLKIQPCDFPEPEPQSEPQVRSYIEAEAVVARGYTLNGVPAVVVEEAAWDALKSSNVALHEDLRISRAANAELQRERRALVLSANGFWARCGWLVAVGTFAAGLVVWGRF